MWTGPSTSTNASAAHRRADPVPRGQARGQAPGLAPGLAPSQAPGLTPGLALADDSQASRRGRCCRGSDDFEYSAGRVANQVEFAVRVHAEGTDVPQLAGVRQRRGVLGHVRGGRFPRTGIDIQRQRPDAALNEVREKVSALKGRPERRTAIDVTASDRLAGT